MPFEGERDHRSPSRRPAALAQGAAGVGRRSRASSNARSVSVVSPCSQRTHSTKVSLKSAESPTRVGLRPPSFAGYAAFLCRVLRVSAM